MQTCPVKAREARSGGKTRERRSGPRRGAARGRCRAAPRAGFACEGAGGRLLPAPLRAAGPAAPSLLPLPCRASRCPFPAALPGAPFLRLPGHGHGPASQPVPSSGPGLGGAARPACARAEPEAWGRPGSDGLRGSGGAPSRVHGLTRCSGSPALSF